MKPPLTHIIALVAVALTGCGKETCVANTDNPDTCPTTYNIAPVCGCDGVTYVNASVAECHEIFTYTEGECEG